MQFFAYAQLLQLDSEWVKTTMCVSLNHQRSC